MPQKATGKDTATGHYEFEVTVGGRKKRVIWDPGFSQPDCLVGFTIDPDNYDRLKKDGKLTEERTHPARTATGQEYAAQTGIVEAQLLDDAGNPLGPKLKIRILRNSDPRQPRLMGMCFLRALTGLTLTWELGGEDPPVIQPTG